MPHGFSVISRSRQSFRPMVQELESRLAPAAGIDVTPPTGLITTEQLGAAQFEVKLTQQPTATVLINLRTTDQTEGGFAPTSLLFGPDNWNLPQSVTITGVNDFVDDGDIPYMIVLDPAQSSDSQYNGIRPTQDVSVTNLDNDAAGFVITPQSGLIIYEGKVKWLTVRLTSEPTSPLTVKVLGAPLGRATVSPTSLSFTPANWNAPKTLSVKGVKGTLAGVPYAVSLVAPTSADPNYARRQAAATVMIRKPPIQSSTTLTSSLNPSPAGKKVTFTATVRQSAGPKVGAPTGTVTFLVDGMPTQISLVKGLARFTPSQRLAVGRHTIKAVYSGSLKLKASRATLIQVVLPPEPINLSGIWKGSATLSDAACDYAGKITLQLQGNNLNAIAVGTITLDLKLVREKKPGFCTPTQYGQRSVLVTATTERFVLTVPGEYFSAQGTVVGNKITGTLFNFNSNVVQNGVFTVAKQ